MPYKIDETTERAILSRPDSGWTDVSEVESPEKSENAENVEESDRLQEAVDSDQSLEQLKTTESPEYVSKQDDEKYGDIEQPSRKQESSILEELSEPDIRGTNFFNKYRIPLVFTFSATVLLIFLLVFLPNSKDGMPDLTKPGTVTSDKPFTIQIAAYREETRATNHMNELRTKGIDSYIVYPSGDSNRWYRVRFGYFDSATSATQYADSLKVKGLISDYFVSRFEVGKIPDEP